MANAGLRNYLFIRLHTDTGLTGIGEATLSPAAYSMIADYFPPERRATPLTL